MLLPTLLPSIAAIARNLANGQGLTDEWVKNAEYKARKRKEDEDRNNQVRMIGFYYDILECEKVIMTMTNRWMMRSSLQTLCLFSSVQCFGIINQPPALGTNRPLVCFSVCLPACQQILATMRKMLADQEAEDREKRRQQVEAHHRYQRELDEQLSELRQRSYNALASKYLLL